MIPFGAIISLAGQAASGIMSAINNRKAKQETDAEFARQQAHYDAEAAENPIARSENQAVINQYDRAAKKQQETARNISTITGATPEYSLGVQKATAEGRAELLSGIGAQASARADIAREKSEQSKHREWATEQARRQARNQTYSNLATNAANAFGSIVSSYQTKPVTPSASPAPTEAQKTAAKAATSMAPTIQQATAQVPAAPDMSAVANQLGKTNTGAAVASSVPSKAAGTMAPGPNKTQILDSGLAQVKKGLPDTGRDKVIAAFSAQANSKMAQDALDEELRKMRKYNQ